MKSIINYTSKFAIAILIAEVMIFSSCEKLVEVDSKSIVLNDDVFASDANATAALLGMYSNVSLFTNTSLVYPTVACGLTSDELLTFTAIEQVYYNNSILSSDGNLRTYWGDLYVIIYQANMIIEGVRQSQTLSETAKKQLTGEALFVRAFMHFYLTAFFGDVPLITKSDVAGNLLLPRTPAAEVYQQMVADLEEAKTLLAVDYPSAGKVRANKYAAAALLARVYLYQKKWDKAEAQANEVIGSGQYTPLPALATAFKANNKESILQNFTLNGFANLGTRFIPAAATPALVMRPELVDAFEPGDDRKTEWTRSIVFSGTTYLYPYKYKNRTTTTGAAAENVMFLRAGEVYLIRAEARIQQDNISDGIKDLNILRLRARAVPTVAVPNPLPDFPLTLDKADALLAVEKERRIELFAEWGNRWFDLRRTGRIDVVLGTLKPTLWQTTDALYPIPQSERSKNNNLTQNDGYQ